MRLALLVYNSLDAISGGYLYDRKLVDYLEEQGDTVEIVSIPWRNYLRHLMDNFSASLFNRLRELKADILLQDELNHPSLFWTNRRLKSKIGCPIISIVHHLRSSEIYPGPENAFYRSIEKIYLSSVDGFILNSQTTRHEVVKLIKREPSGVVAYPGADRFSSEIQEGEITQRAMQNGPLRLMFVGNLIRRKGLKTLLDALSQVPAECCKLNIVGSMEVDKTYVREVRQQVIEKGLDDRVEFLGIMEDADLANLMCSNHVMVVPSTYEGFGIVYLEGMGFGLPAIGTTSGAAREIITPEVNGFLITPNDASNLARYLIELSQNRKRLLDMSLASLRSYRSHPTWKQSGEQIRAYLQGFLERRT
jgi:glycosyltransferase involved in cell wall biosynthesis